MISMMEIFHVQNRTGVGCFLVQAQAHISTSARLDWQEAECTRDVEWTNTFNNNGNDNDDNNNNTPWPFWHAVQPCNSQITGTQLCCPACPQCRSCLARLICGWRGTVLSRTLCWAPQSRCLSTNSKVSLRPRSLRHPGMERCFGGSDLACRVLCFACVPLPALSREALHLACRADCQCGRDA